MLSHRFDDALRFAADMHRDQKRKGTDIPYFAHLLSVAALTIEYEGDEDCAIAALLHDAVDYQGGEPVADAIANRFGDKVRKIVLECSDRNGDKDSPWRQRKEDYIKSISNKSRDAVLVTSCDKLHDATSILQDLITDGLTVFSRFNAPRNDILWYYREFAEGVQMRNPGPLSMRLSQTVSQMEYTVNTTD